MSKANFENGVLNLLKLEKTPLTTQEVAKLAHHSVSTITKILLKLRGDNKIYGKQTKERGPWIWWIGGAPSGVENIEHIRLKRAVLNDVGRDAILEHIPIKGKRLDVYDEPTNCGFECTTTHSKHTVLMIRTKWKDLGSKIVLVASKKGYEKEIYEGSGFELWLVEGEMVAEKLKFEESEQFLKDLKEYEGGVFPRKCGESCKLTAKSSLKILDSSDGVYVYIPPEICKSTLFPIVGNDVVLSVGKTHLKITSTPAQESFDSLLITGGVTTSTQEVIENG